jgi:hypothetical protein
MKVKFAVKQAMKVYRESRGIVLLFFNLGCSNAWPSRFNPRKETRYPFVGGWVGPWASLDGCGKTRPHWDSIPRCRVQKRMEFFLDVVYFLLV